MSYGQAGNLTSFIFGHGGVHIMLITLLSLENWKLGVKSVSLLDTQTTLNDMCLLVKIQVELCLNWNHEMSVPYH